MFMRAGAALARRFSSAFQTADAAGGYREHGMPNRHRGWSRDGVGNRWGRELDPLPLDPEHDGIGA